YLGRHPYLGRFLAPGEMPAERAIREHRFVYGQRAKQLQMAPPPWSLPLLFAPGEIARLFERAFDPASVNGGRPSATEWRIAIDRCGKGVRACARDRLHAFPSNLRSCPWCAFAAGGGPEFFGEVRSGRLDFA